MRTCFFFFGIFIRFLFVSVSFNVSGPSSPRLVDHELEADDGGGVSRRKAHMLAGFIVIITTHSSALIYQQSMFVDAFGGGPRRVRVSENAIIKNGDLLQKWWRWAWIRREYLIVIAMFGGNTPVDDDDATARHAMKLKE